MNDEAVREVKFDGQGLVPAIVQDAETGAVLMLAYMNRESLQRTIETGETHFWSRSRRELWRKGETSGNTQTVRSLKLDCDADTVLISVDQKGNACHTGTYSCFTNDLHETSTQSDSLPSAIGSLARVIAERKRELPEKSYTTQLLRGGIDKILKKVGEESAEVIIAAKNKNREEIAWEVADLLYHVMVMCAAEDVPLGSVASQLVQRQGKVSKSIQPG